MKRLHRAISSRIKNALDRRYLKVEELGRRAATVEQLGEVATVDDLEALQRRIDDLERSISVNQTELSRLKIGADFVASEDPHELRKKLFAAYRLANECATAIERLLQADLLIRRDLDTVSGERVEPTV